MVVRLQACYRKLSKYKYQLVGNYEVIIPIKGQTIVTDFLELYGDGSLIIRRGYSWDGPSGPTIDTMTFMRGALIHDVLYQLMRMSLLDPSHRRGADDILRQVCLEDGMNRIRAWYVYWSVRMFAAIAAKPGTQKPMVITCVPVEKTQKEKSRE